MSKPLYLLAPVAALALTMYSLAADAAAESAAEAPAGARFDIQEFRVLGNSVLAAADIERAVYPFLGPDRSLEEIEAARAALEAAYRERGYGTVFVDIPQQDVGADGIVRLGVTEAKLHDVSLAGGRYFARRDVETALTAAAEGTVPHLPTLQAELARVNAETPDRTVVPVLKSGPIPGTVDLDLKVDDRLPFHGSLELNDQYTADTSKLRALAAIRYDNFLGRLDSLSLQYQTAPEETDEVKVLAASYVARLSDTKRLAFFYVDSSNDVATVGTLSVLGNGQVYGTRFVNTFANTPLTTQSLTLGLDYKDFVEDILLEPDESVVTPISYLHWSATYAGAWRSATRNWDLAVGAGFGLRGLGNDPGEFADKRFRARPNYFYLRPEAGLVQQLPAGFTFAVRVAGQFAVEPLISNEQFAIGGARSVRGFLEAEQLGDMGIQGTLELVSPPLKLAALRGQATAFVFMDQGVVSVLSPLPDEPSRFDLGSVGAGLNFGLWDRVSGSLTWAYPLVPSDRTADGDDRLLFSIRGEW